MSINTEMAVRVTAITQVAEKVKRFRFERTDGLPLPVFSGGAHVVVAMRDGEILRRNPFRSCPPRTINRLMKFPFCALNIRVVAQPLCMSM